MLATLIDVDTADDVVRVAAQAPGSRFAAAVNIATAAEARHSPVPASVHGGTR